MDYKGIIKDKETGEKIIRTFEGYRDKDEVVQTIRANGYAVDWDHVKPTELFDWIMDHTNCEPIDWKLTKVPANYDEYRSFINKKLDQQWDASRKSFQKLMSKIEEEK